MNYIKNLYYSKNEKLVFWVAGYDYGSLSEIAIGAYKSFKRQSLTAKKLFNVNQKNIFTYVIKKSTKYKLMRVFYAKCNVAPPNAFIISNENNQTMLTYLEA